MAGKAAAPRKVTVSIVSWNGRRHLETCLDALAKQHDPGVPWEVVVLDNGSSDDTVASLRARKTPYELRLIESPLRQPLRGCHFPASGEDLVSASAACRG